MTTKKTARPRRTAPLIKAKATEALDDGTLISSGQVCKILGLGRSMVHNLVAEGKLPPPKLKTPGGKGRWSQFEIMQVRRAWEKNADVVVPAEADQEL